MLRDRCAPTRGTQKGDVYSFALILVHVHGRCEPWAQMPVLSSRGRLYHYSTYSNYIVIVIVLIHVHLYSVYQSLHEAKMSFATKLLSQLVKL